MADKKCVGGESIENTSDLGSSISELSVDRGFGGEGSSENVATSTPIAQERVGGDDLLMLLMQHMKEAKKQMGQIRQDTSKIREIQDGLAALKMTVETGQGELNTRVGAVEERVDVLETNFTQELSKNEERFKKLDKHVEVENSKLKVEVVQTRRILEEKLESNKKNSELKFAEISNQISNVDLKCDEKIDLCKNNVVGLSKKVVELQEGVAQRNFVSNFNCVWGGIPLKCFPGDGKLHPVDFLQHCQDNFSNDMTDNVKIKFVKRFLDGEAISWANQNVNSTMSYNEFERKFLNKFWSDSEQARIKSEFLNGRMYRESDGSLKCFCESQLRKLVHLDKPFDELIQIDALKRRLPKRVQWELIYGPDDSVDQFLSVETARSRGAADTRWTAHWDG
ncbi:uncharacterized protein LOC126278572 [Schistocerca gregaria]|uniref:uncharacterized protein LOC126278572 n=2 Tax=Schistocerca gregaria TaxID=7010 RepID=UPI00211E4C09|nr:uncharacterized protein LOC126278572 [Schistocerca gregaria]